jgi:hypothetical protein
MTMGLPDIVAREADSGFARLRGTRIDGSIPLAQTTLNDLVQQSAPAPRGVQMELHPANRLVVQYGLLHVTAVLDEELDVGSSLRLRLRLASAVIAWTLRRTVRHPAVTIDGRVVTVDLGRMTPISDYRHIWRHLRRVRVTTASGQLLVQFQFAIE